MKKGLFITVVTLLLFASISYAEIFTWYIGRAEERTFGYMEYLRKTSFFSYGTAYATKFGFGTSSSYNGCENKAQVKLYLEDNIVYTSPSFVSIRSKNNYYEGRLPLIYSNKLSVQKSGGKETHDGHKCWLSVHNGMLRLIENPITGQDSVTVEDEAKLLGTSRSLMGPLNDLVGFTINSVRVGSNNLKVLVWVGDDDDYGRDTTDNYQDGVYACLDANTNDVCDFNEGQLCLADGGDWYINTCCRAPLASDEPVKYNTVTSCEYNSNLKAICGNPSPSVWQWVPLETDLGQIYHLSECPGGDIISDGSSYYYCGQTRTVTGAPYQSFDFVKVNSHEYYCDKANDEILECAGENFPYSDNNRQTGFSLEGRPYAECIQGAISYWNFDDEDASDSLGGNDGTATGVTFVDGQKGKGAIFDGSSKIEIPSSADISDPGSEITVEAWFKSTDTDGKSIIIDKHDSYRIMIDAGVLKGALMTENTEWSLIGGSPSAAVDENKWYHVALTYSEQNGNLKLYLNGVNVASANQVGKVNSSVYPLIIGYRESPSQNFGGIIDEVAIYNKALSQSQIDDNYQGAELCSVITQEGRFYCASDSDWTQDLDEKDAETCIQAGYEWTGSKCCGEVEDEEEFYNDQDKPAENFIPKIIFKSSGASTSSYEINLTENNDFVSLQGPMRVRVVIKSEAFEFGESTECDTISKITETIKQGETKTYINIEPDVPFPSDAPACTLRNIYLYSEPSLAIGGCWNESRVLTGDFVSGDFIDDNSIINHKGGFYRCNLTETDLLSIKDSFTNTQLIQEITPCGVPLLETTPGRHSVCQPTGDWSFTDNPGTTILKSIIWNTQDAGVPETMTKGCCASDECWNGADCQKVGTTQRVGDDGYLCQLPSTGPMPRQAAWVPVELKFSWDRVMSGSCARNSQCLVHPSGNTIFDDMPTKYFEATTNNEKPKCIDNGQHILDYYCNSGNWASRTKLIASQLLNFAQNAPGYSIYCDSYENILNRYIYLTSFGAVDSYLNENCDISGSMYACVNNFCVLKYGNSVAFGTSLNVPINDANKPFLHTLDLNEDVCSNVPVSSQTFVKCSTQDGRLWYNPSINAVIYFPTAMQTSLDPTVISGAYTPIEDYVMNVLNDPNEPADDYTFFTKTSLFKKIYYAVYGGKSIFAFMEEDQTPLRIDYMGIKYAGMNFNQDPCFEIFGQHYDGVNCQAQGQNLILVSKSDPTQQNPLLNAWIDLTAKLRPK